MTVSDSRIKFIASLLDSKDPDIVSESVGRFETDSIRVRKVPLLDIYGHNHPKQIYGDIQFDFDYQTDVAYSPRTFNSPGEGLKIEIVGVEPNIRSISTADGRKLNANNDPKYIEAAKSYFMSHLVEQAEEHIQGRNEEQRYER